jgi:hypothetical protein
MLKVEHLPSMGEDPYKNVEKSPSEMVSWGWGCSSVIECLSSMLRALGSIPALKKNGFLPRHQWLTPVILATQESEIRRIVVRSQLGQIVCKTLS